MGPLTILCASVDPSISSIVKRAIFHSVYLANIEWFNRVIGVSWHYGSEIVSPGRTGACKGRRRA
jgi:hypothetical protein